MKKILCAVLAFGLFEGATNAQILVNDNFNNRVDEASLVGTAPSPGPGSLWTTHSGVLGDLVTTNGQVYVKHGVPSEDANISFADQTIGVITATFDIIVNADVTIGDGGSSDFEYFAHFMQTNTFNFYSRLDIVAPNSTGDYTLGIATTASTAENTFGTDFNFGDTVSVALTYDWGTGLSSVTVGATTISSTTVSNGVVINAFALRQSDSSQNESILVDNLVVSWVPEPSTITLGGLGLVTLLLARRRR